jgi:hypothetical protein
MERQAEAKAASSLMASGSDEVYYSVDEVAARLKVSPRWLADQCREGLVEHVHLARKRKFTPAQVELLLDKHTVRPADVEARDKALARTVRKVQKKRETRGRR